MIDSILPQTETSRNVRDMRESRRALELRKFFAPSQFLDPDLKGGYNDSINSDGALDAYVETVLWRLRGTHAMVSLIDRDVQFFLAGATRKADPMEDEIAQESSWFGCSNVKTPGGLCENTIKLKNTASTCPCFIVSDLSKDERFASLPVVDGSIASYRFYAGTPITSIQGVNIGTLFLFDEKPRQEFSDRHREFLNSQATNIMRHLETKREAAERRRVALMSKGIAGFLERTAKRNGDVSRSEIAGGQIIMSNTAGTDTPENTEAFTTANHANDVVNDANASVSYAKSTVLDQIRKTLDEAAEILRQSLELVVGGVVFLDPTVGYSETGHNEAYLDPSTDLGHHVQEQEAAEKRRNSLNEETSRAEYMSNIDDLRHASSAVRNSVDKHKPAKVQSMSASNIATWDPDSKVLDSKTLQTLISSYPNGNVWYIDDDGFFQSLEQIHAMQQISGSQKRSLSPSATTRQRAEAVMLSEVFHKAKQIIFLPLWDVGGDRWYSGCFVWSQSAVPVFTVDSEIAYLSTFTNSVMVEINRLDAITANKVKSDFISSISHEFRSPLHGILASAEFLRDTNLTNTQLEFISTIQSCGGTLLDTMNHVLDYSKINSFEKKSGNEQDSSTGISNELFQVANLALLCEDLLNGMIAGNEYQAPVTGTANLPSNQTEIRSRLAIILDIESRDWDFTIQAGALRRVVMNIFGNAQKYTDSGYILVRLRVQDGNGETPSGKFLRLNIRDSGRGMSSEYMERKLYHPFAQEDSFATGVGLGLSIVWSIVNQLGGKIHVRSELGKGTDVEVTLPLEKAGEPQGLSVDAADSVYASVDGTRTLETLRQRATGKSVSIFRNSKPGAPHKDVFWGCISRYCRDWYGFDIKPSGGHIIITDEHDMDKLDQYGKIMVVHKSMVCSKRDATQHRVIDICSPVGPFKLAKTLLELLDRDEGPFASHRTDAGTQTPAGSPEERKILNGLILTDYGFPRQSLPEVLAASAEKVDTEGVSLSKPPTNHFIERSLSTSLKLPLRLTKSASDSKLRQSAAITTPQPPISRQESTTLHPLSSLSSDTTPKHIPEDISRSHPPKQDPSPTAGLHILAVDDNAVNLQLLQRYLQKRKHDTIITARNGFEAVEAYKAALSNTELHLQTFDVVFMDISMPGMDGFEATRVIRKLETEQAAADKEASLSDEEIGKRRAYVVALTGLASSRDRHEAVESGLDDFFTKPVSFKKIGELLGRLERMAQGNKRGE